MIYIYIYDDFLIVWNFPLNVSVKTSRKCQKICIFCECSMTIGNTTTGKVFFYSMIVLMLIMKFGISHPILLQLQLLQQHLKMLMRSAAAAAEKSIWVTSVWWYRKTYIWKGEIILHSKITLTCSVLNNTVFSGTIYVNIRNIKFLREV